MSGAIPLLSCDSTPVGGLFGYRRNYQKEFIRMIITAMYSDSRLTGSATPPWQD